MHDRAAADHDAKMRERMDKILALITLPAWLPAILGYALIEDLPNGKTIISQSPGWLTPCLWLVGWISPLYFVARILLVLPASMAENRKREAKKKKAAARKAETESKIPMYRKIATREARQKNESKKFLLSLKNRRRHPDRQTVFVVFSELFSRSGAGYLLHIAGSLAAFVGGSEHFVVIFE